MLDLPLPALIPDRNSEVTIHFCLFPFQTPIEYVDRKNIGRKGYKAAFIYLFFFFNAAELIH